MSRRYRLRNTACARGTRRFVYAAFMPVARFANGEFMPPGHTCGVPQSEGTVMLDILFVLLTVGFFLAAAASIRVFERL